MFIILILQTGVIYQEDFFMGQAQLIAVAFSVAYYLPSLLAGLKKRSGGERHWPAKAAMYATYGVFYAVSLAFFQDGEPASWLNYLGLFPALAGVVLHYLAIKSLGDSYSAGIKFSKKPRLVTTGVYALASHPLYSASALFFLGLAVLLFSPYSVAAYALVVAYLAYRISVEEKLLRQKFAAQYADYSSKVPATVFGWLLKLVLR